MPSQIVEAAIVETAGPLLARRSQHDETGHHRADDGDRGGRGESDAPGSGHDVSRSSPRRSQR